MRIDLVDSRTGTAIEFSGNRPFELAFLIEFVPFFLPRAIEKSIVQSQIGPIFSPSNAKHFLVPGGTISQDMKENSQREHSR